MTAFQATLYPWLSIWTKPRATVRQIVDSDPTYMVLPIAAVLGICQVLGQVPRFAGNSAVWVPILIVAFLLGPVIGIIQNYIGAWYLNGIFQWCGGKATPKRLAVQSHGE